MGRGGTPGLKPPEYGFTARRLGRGRVGMTCGNRRGRDEACALSGKLQNMRLSGKAGGQLVMLGFGVAAFAPASYQRRSLRRPCET